MACHSASIGTNLPSNFDFENIGTSFDPAVFNDPETNLSTEDVEILQFCMHASNRAVIVPQTQNETFPIPLHSPKDAHMKDSLSLSGLSQLNSANLQTDPSSHGSPLFINTEDYQSPDSSTIPEVITPGASVILQSQQATTKRYNYIEYILISQIPS